MQHQSLPVMSRSFDLVRMVKLISLKVLIECYFSMKPGEYMQFNKQSNHMVVASTDPSIAAAWKDGKFVFIHKTLAEICRELESWYNVQL